MAEDLVTSLEDELTEYVGFQRRRGFEMRFSDALLGHRKTCVENYLDAGEDHWIDRIRALDTLAERKGIPMHEVRPLRNVIDERAETERRGRAEAIRR